MENLNKVCSLFQCPRALLLGFYFQIWYILLEFSAWGWDIFYLTY